MNLAAYGQYFVENYNAIQLLEFVKTIEKLIDDFDFTMALANHLDDHLEELDDFGK